MISIQFWAEGSTPLLLHKVTEQDLMAETRQNTPSEREDPRDFADRHVYRLKSGQLALPGSGIARMIREAGGGHKAKGSRKSLKYIVPAAVIILDDLCGLFLNDRKTPIKEYEVDSRPVIIPSTKGRVMRHRARLNEWSVTCRLRINETIMDEAIVRRLAIEGLQQIGLGDYRPEKGGSFGVSDLTSWEIISAAKPKTAGQNHAVG